MDRWILAAVCTAGFLFFAGANAVYLWINIGTRFKGGPSLAPIFGGLLGAMAVMLAPVGAWTTRAPYCLVPLLADVGCLPYLALFLWSERRR